MPASVLEATPPGTARRNPSLSRRRVHTLTARLQRACLGRRVIMPTACFRKNCVAGKKKLHTPRRLVGCCCSEMMRLLFVVCCLYAIKHCNRTQLRHYFAVTAKQLSTAVASSQSRVRSKWWRCPCQGTCPNGEEVHPR